MPLLTCRQIAREATPVLYDAMHFNFNFLRGTSFAEPVPGRLVRSHSFVHNIRSMNLFVPFCDAETMRRAAESIATLFVKSPGVHQDVKITDVRLRVEGKEPFNADPVYQALLALPCPGGFPVHNMPTKHQYISADVFQAFRDWSGAEFSWAILQ